MFHVFMFHMKHECTSSPLDYYFIRLKFACHFIKSKKFIVALKNREKEVDEQHEEQKNVEKECIHLSNFVRLNNIFFFIYIMGK